MEVVFLGFWFFLHTGEFMELDADVKTADIWNYGCSHPARFMRLLVT